MRSDTNQLERHSRLSMLMTLVHIVHSASNVDLNTIGVYQLAAALSHTGVARPLQSLALGQ